jgi:hypothetical protein
MLALELIAERKIAEAAKGGKKLSLLNARIEARYFKKIARKLAF